MTLSHPGELAALATAGCWTMTALAFESASRRGGSLTVNLIRLVLGFGFLVALGWIRRGAALPTDATPEAWLWLSISGLIGFAFGDLCLFRAFVLIGSRMSLLLMSLVPPMTALIGWAVLGEVMNAREWLGMALTVGGVAWVVLERAPDPNGERRRTPWFGVALGLGGALGQALGLVLSKFGMRDYDPFAANQIRVLAGIAGFAVIFTGLRWWPRLLEAARHGKAMSRTVVGAVFGPFLGVSFSLVAVQNTTAGVASTIMALPPVLILPIAIWLLREHISIRAAAGALLAVAGTAVLFS
jgi:drug/metabolite transporter (DMT)-like permease